MISELSYITHLSAEIKLFFQTIKLVPFGKKNVSVHCSFDTLPINVQFLS